MFNPKSMRPVEDLISEFNEGSKELSLEEERLIDAVLFERTGQRTSKFSKAAKQLKPMSINKSLSKDAHDIPMLGEVITKELEKPPKGLVRL